MAKEKISVDKLMDEIVYTQNQIDGLNMLLMQKKQTMAKYFEQSGKSSVSNDECTVYVQERTTVDYDIDAILETLDKELSDQFVDKSYKVTDWARFVSFMKDRGISGKEIKKFFLVEKKIDKEKLGKLYEHGIVSIEDLQGCYEAKVTKSVALRLKNAKREINLT